jgi:hypothetical protein
MIGIAVCCARKRTGETNTAPENIAVNFLRLTRPPSAYAKPDVCRSNQKPRRFCNISQEPKAAASEVRWRTL